MNASVLGNEEGFVLKSYPNPATSFVQVNLQNRGVDASYKIVNTIGQLVQKGSLIDANINVSSLTPGIYILQVSDGQKAFRTKLVKE